MEQDIGGVGAVAEIAEIVHNLLGGPDIGLEGIDEAALAAGAGGEVVDERGGAGEEGVEAVLDGLVGDGGGQMRLAADAAAGEDQVATLRHELGREAGAEQGPAQFGLDGEVELLDGLEQGEAGLAHAAPEAGFGAVGDFLAGQSEQELMEGPSLAFGAFGERGIGAAGVGQVQALEQGGELVGRSRAARRRLGQGRSRAHLLEGG